ncbi:MAG: 3-isopropylmalate dehydratase large subunit [Planctomycetota bacterium]|nr:MAG: 3-isopropylmalate dehydratase large subunit [Planctomycetota bacterium]
MPTLSEQILSRAAGRAVVAGEIVTLSPDRIMLHDAIGPSVITVLREELDCERLPDPERVAVVIDHVAPAANLATATHQQALRRWVREQGISHFFESGRGICHQVLIEERLALPGQVVIGTDSHSTTYGAVCAFGTGMGSTDVALCLASGRTWMRVPNAVRIDVRGRFAPGTGPKDLALAIVDRLGAGGATGAALELFGLDELPLAGRMTVASMAVEAGATAGLVWPAGLEHEGLQIPPWLHTPDDGATYVERLEIDLGALRSRVARPGRVDDQVDAEELANVALDVVYVGTCTNGRLDDLHRVARVLDGQRVADGVRLVVVPASSRVLAEAVDDGTAATLLAAGATIGPPGCGACIGRHMGVLAPGETAVFTGNRNFTGRMGSPDASIYLASPEVAAASALSGHISAPTSADSAPDPTSAAPLPADALPADTAPLPRAS